MNLDLTAAVDAAAQARYEHVRQSRLLYEAPPAWHDLAPQHQHGWREGVLNEVAAAAPLIAAQVAEQIAAAIASRRQSAETADEFDGLDAAEAIAREAVR